jgi:heterodisulfide reductase subunit B
MKKPERKNEKNDPEEPNLIEEVLEKLKKYRPKFYT